MAITLAVLSTAAVVFLLEAHEVPRGVREGVAFLLIFVFVGAVVVLLVRHAPSTVLQLGGPTVLLVGGIGLAFLLDPPTRYVAIAAALLGGVNLVLRLQRARQRRPARSARPLN